jgi:Na+/H+ antiporter NhaD/arsenite permease-like protein
MEKTISNVNLSTQFAGTNIGTTILLCRILQAWVTLHTAGPENPNATPISQRTFWASVYSMALAVNYGAFSTAFSASLAGLLWRDILARKKIFVGARSFVCVNLPIITLTMVVGLVVLIGEVYLTRSTDPYVSRTA